MAIFRLNALEEAASHRCSRFYEISEPVSSYFGENVLTPAKMREYVSPEAFEAVMAAVDRGEKIDRSTADDIAAGMMKWALEKGATHYTHLFQPLTGSTAEKHEAFISFGKDGAIEYFSGSALVQQEPDASSFPSGGLRNTFEARGYSAWDPNSSVFILDGTMCIPSIFVSYTGEALDMKVPHLKSLHAIGNAAVKVASLFDPAVRKVTVNLGLEQEYFVVDESLYNARADLVLTGRTVLGHTSAKDQQLDDHYFGAIPSRVVGFMKDFETEAFKLGIRLQTRHNEVAPNQFECAPMFSEATVSIDQNMLLMIVMQKVAEKHRLKVIFHEKPFDGVNGSGKHCNWSLSTDTGVNLLSPGSTPMKNLQFLSFFSCVMRAVRRHDYLLMASTSSLSNSYRLGGAEAPPAVMSIFAGSTLYKVFETLAGLSSGPSSLSKVESLDIVASIPEIFPDNTDRNRTSPFAFSGNRFEFRAVGSSVNPASSIYVLNAAVAESLEDFYSAVTALKAAGTSSEDAVMSVIRDFVKESFDILFEGNGYSEEWHEEARRRGLRGVTNVPDSFKAFIEKESLDLFESTGVLSCAETLSRYEVFNESYVKKLQIEARVIGDICKNHIIPAAIAYKNVLSGDIERAKMVFPDEWESLCAASISSYRKISHLVNRLSEDLEELVEERKKANAEPDMATRASMYSHSVAAEMAAVRSSADKLEMIVDDELWPIPKYRELLFL